MADVLGTEKAERASQSSKEIDILWITAGPGCDGDSVAITAAIQPSLEDIVLGGIPNIPKVNFHHPLLAYETGDEFMKRFELAAEGKVDPFVLVIEGSIPDETVKQEGYWAGFGTNKASGQPITSCEWIDRLGPARGPCWRRGRVQRTAASMRSKEIPRVVWGCRPTWGGNGSRRPAFPSFVYRDVQSNRTILWRPYCTCSSKRPTTRR